MEDDTYEGIVYNQERRSSLVSLGTFVLDPTRGKMHRKFLMYASIALFYITVPLTLLAAAFAITSDILSYLPKLIIKQALALKAEEILIVRGDTSKYEVVIEEAPSSANSKDNNTDS